MSQEEMEQCWKRLAEKMEEEVLDKYKVFPFWMDPRFLTICRQQLSDPPSIFGVRSTS